VISVAAGLVQAHPRTLRIYEDEGLLAPARTPTNIRLYSENDIRRILWIRRLTQERGVNLAGVRLIFELEERLGKRILEALFADDLAREAGAAASTAAMTQPQASDDETSDESRASGRADWEVAPTARSITRIVATRVTSNGSGDSND
jgi:MerR family transcriptional regulator/heat shock protein HspR